MPTGGVFGDQHWCFLLLYPAWQGGIINTQDFEKYFLLMGMGLREFSTGVQLTLIWVQRRGVRQFVLWHAGALARKPGGASSDRLDTLARYQRCAMEFQISSEREEDGRWIAEIEALPGVLAYGESKQEPQSKVEALALQSEPF
ncbi:MAG: type II toxin-antitoxin system HicB family antitoxin [Acidobacteriota bacterium]